MMGDLDYLKNVRAHHRTQVTKKCKNVQDNCGSFTSREVEENILSLDSLRQKLDDCNTQISELIWKSDKGGLAAELKSCDEYDEKITSAISFLKSVPNVCDGNDVSNKLKLPELPLPVYSHARGESIEKFFRDFEDITGRANLNSYTKLLYLQRQTRKEPHTLIQSLSSGSLTYEDAKKLLMEAFGFVIVQKYDSIKLLSELRLSYQDDPYKLIGEMKMIRDTFNNLSVSVDDILQFFYWSSLNESFRSQLIQITGNSKPSLKEIDDHIFEATERYVEAQEKFKRQRKSNECDAAISSFAANVKPLDESVPSRFRVCILCSKSGESSDHPIYKCLNFASPKLETEKLKSLHACCKCANFHRTKDCKFRFNTKCKHCSKWHFSFLCPSRDSQQSDISTDTPNTVSHNGLACVDLNTLHVTAVSSSILPTFSSPLPDGSLVRCLKDSGSQMTFVNSDLADRQGFEVINPNFSLVVKGFNESRTFNTKIVRLQLMSEHECHMVEAVCIPEIKTRLHLPGLGKIVHEFSKRGYSLADKFLKATDDEIANINLLLGTDCEYAIPVSTKIFGGTVPSVYLESSYGIMLCGQVDTISDNLKYLPCIRPQFLSCNVVSKLGDSDIAPVLENSAKSPISLDSNPEISVVDEKGNVNETELQKAVDNIIFQERHRILNYDNNNYNDTSIESHDKLIDFVLESTTRNEEGRLVMPLLWNSEVSHLLGNNQRLSKLILNSNLRKYRNRQHLSMMDEVFREQENLGIIKRVDNLPEFLKENPNFSFLPHMPIFRMDKESTKCRIVYLLNLSEKDTHKPMTVS
ncbi:uncharacterized protein [Palaemon carinicauda]|uniref:uncharacterized protein n=1 Tax=Palaemon carinicauda TaxID=392227 RepID=UPI0035B60D40